VGQFMMQGQERLWKGSYRDHPLKIESGNFRAEIRREMGK